MICWQVWKRHSESVALRRQSQRRHACFLLQHIEITLCFAIASSPRCLLVQHTLLLRSCSGYLLFSSSHHTTLTFKRHLLKTEQINRCYARFLFLTEALTYLELSVAASNPIHALSCPWIMSRFRVIFSSILSAPFSTSSRAISHPASSASSSLPTTLLRSP